MKAIYQIKYMRIMCFLTVMSFALALLTGCVDQTLSHSLTQEAAFITDDNTDDNMDDIPAESHELYDKNSGTAGDETTEQALYIYVIEDDGAVITGLQEEYEILLQQNISNDKIIIPDTLGGYPVVEIGDCVYENIKLKGVYLPDSVEVIGDSAFRNTGIEDINISECYNLKKVGANAFENCNLQNYYSDYYPLSQSMEEIGERAFAGNAQLTPDDRFEWYFYQMEDGIFYADWHSSIERLENGGFKINIVVAHSSLVYGDFPKEPSVRQVGKNLLEVSVSVGSPARYTFYIDKEDARESDTYFNPILVGEEYVAYMEDGKLILSDIFYTEQQEDLLYMAIVRDFAKTADPISAIKSIKLIDSDNIELTYLTGEDYMEVTEIIPIDGGA